MFLTLLQNNLQRGAVVTPPPQVVSSTGGSASGGFGYSKYNHIEKISDETEEQDLLVFMKTFLATRRH